MGVRLDARLALLGQSGAELAGAAPARRANPLRLCSPRNVRELHAPVPVLSTAFEVERARPGIYVATAPQELNGERWIFEGMKRSARAVVVSLVLALLLGCATPPVRPLPVRVADLSTEVGAAFQNAVAAWNAGNLEGFLAIYSEAATFALADEYLQGRRAIGEFYAGNFQPGATRGELSMERLDVELLSPDTALVRGIYRNMQGGQVTRRGTTTLVMRKVMGVWRIIHDHSS
jgi:uncharacterized protein (TIGR02246 family)